MASDPPQTLPFVAKARGREAEAADDEDDISTTVAAESTPLLRSSSATSVTGSSRTVRTVRSADHCQGPRLLDGQAEATTPLLATSPPRPSPSAAASEKLSAPRIVLICASVWLLIFLQAANMSGMTMTQSSVALELRASGGEAVWFTSTYLIAGSSLSPLGGRLAAIFGPVSMVLPCVGAFALGGMLSGGAPSVAWFLVGRCLTGVGAAGIMTLSVILVLALSPESRRGVFIGLVNLGFTIGLSFGAVVFGAVEPLIGWRALFYVQAPIALVAGLGIYLSVPACLNATSSASPTPSSPSSCTSNPTKPPRSQTGPHSSLLKKARQVDYLGALFLVLTISLFLYGLNGSGGRVASTPLLLSGASLLVFLLLETTVLGHGGRPEPIIPLAILSSRGVLLSCLAQLGFMSARWTVLFYAPIYALAVRGMSAAASGSVLIPTNAGFGAGGLIVGYLHIRRAGSFWLASLVALGLFIVALAALSAIVAVQGVAFAVFAAALFLNGLFTGAMLNYTLNHMLHLSPPQDHFVASSLLGTFRGFAGSFGSAIGGGVFARALTGLLTRGFEALDGVKGPLGEERRLLVDRLVASPALIWGSTDDVTGGLPPLTDAERVVAVDSYRNALSFLWRAAVVLAVAMAVVQAATGWHGPPDIVIDEEEIREAVAEHDPEGEA